MPDYVEKKVDVAIAVDLVRMAYEDQYDVAYLLSADADYVTAVKEAQRVGKAVFVRLPRIRDSLAGLAMLSAAGTA